MDRSPNSELLRESLAKNTRRRSLKTLFQLPLSTRTSTYGSLTTTTAVGSIPADIVRDIVDLLPPSDILSLSLASTHLRALLMPALYETVTLKSSKNCKVTLEMLSKRKDICGYIRKLAVRPNYYLAWPKADEHLSEEWVVKMIESISRLYQRRNARLDPMSSLFDFSDLTSFSLIVRHGLGGSGVLIPPRFWDMLIDRCPDLQELAICSFSSRFLFRPPVPSTDQSLGRFLDKHTELKYVRFLWNFKRWMSPDMIPMHLSRSALPVLDTFIGYINNLQSFHILTQSKRWTYLRTRKPLKQLITRLHLLPDLKRFSLTKGHKYIDESMLSTALRILKYNPRLKQINIRWARERCPNHLKQEGTYDVALVIAERGIPWWAARSSGGIDTKSIEGVGVGDVREEVIAIECMSVDCIAPLLSVSFRFSNSTLDGALIWDSCF
ncbi:hypothetical protein BJ912DRAFT_1022422 [Pholiota molesta]|nr:hypothetical protein BJ912DRAFT_1022422 [Pholiota molesta]